MKMNKQQRWELTKQHSIWQKLTSGLKGRGHVKVPMYILLPVLYAQWKAQQLPDTRQALLTLGPGSWFSVEARGFFLEQTANIPFQVSAMLCLIKQLLPTKVNGKDSLQDYCCNVVTTFPTHTQQAKEWKHGSWTAHTAASPHLSFP